MSIKTSGFRELDLALADMKKSTARGVLRRAGLAALGPVVARAKSLAPVRDGYLRDSIVASEKLSKEAKKSAPKLARGERATGITVYAGTSNRNAWPREFGTWRTAAKPFLRPAWDGAKSSILDDLAKILGEEISKTAARAAKRKK